MIGSKYFFGFLNRAILGFFQHKQSPGCRQFAAKVAGQALLEGYLDFGRGPIEELESANFCYLH